MVKKAERIDEQGMAHSMWAPSASERWLICPKSVIETQAMPVPDASPAAAEGSVAHDWCEKILLGERELNDVEDDTMRAGVEIYTEYAEGVFETYENPGYEVEGTVQLEQIIPGGSPPYWSCFGSADFFIYDEDDNQMPEVIDFKYGRHLVEVENNTQLMLYAIGLVDDIQWAGPVKLTIVQPRAAHKDGPIRSWVVTGKQLRDLKIRARKTLLDAHKTPKKAGDHCHYCLLAPSCEAKHVEVQALAGIEFGKVNFEPMIPGSMNEKQIAAIVTHHKAIAKWMESVVAKATTDSKHGKKNKYLKLVRNSGRNGWTDENTFKRMVRELGIEKTDAYKTVPEGMGNIKKVLKEMYDDKPDDLIAEYVTKTEGSVSLVSVDDTRLEYNPAASEFANK